MQRVSRKALGSTLTCVSLLLICPITATGQSGNVFKAHTLHIERQVDVDKRFFVDASTCTEWFYKQELDDQSPPGVEGIAYRPGQSDALTRGRALRAVLDCKSRYPGGLKAAREDFSRTQSTLSLSLTFYEYALVGDGDDDGQYSPAELRDIMESFGLAVQPELSPNRQLSRLNAHFDSVHQTLQFDVLMAGMQVLFDRGYRFTNLDKAELNRVMG